MPFLSGNFLDGGTCSATGGASVGFLSGGVSNLQSTYIVDDSSDLLDQRVVNLSVRPHKPLSSAPNGYTQARSRLNYQVPLALDNGETTVNSITIELSIDPETSVSEIATMKHNVAQFLIDSDFDNFWAKQSMS
jgi:hypothetical protein